VLLARLLALSPRALVLDEPTRGIDVGAKVEVQNLVGELADNGLSVMFISAELEEVLRVGNRVAIVQAVASSTRCRPTSSLPTC
jgi:simple sugar transport system ATP-binding protein